MEKHAVLLQTLSIKITNDHEGGEANCFTAPLIHILSRFKVQPLWTTILTYHMSTIWSFLSPSLTSFSIAVSHDNVDGGGVMVHDEEMRR